jgi:hypothetical protein
MAHRFYSGGLERMTASHPLLKCGSVHEADSGYSCGDLRHAVAEGNFRVPTSISLEKPFEQRRSRGGEAHCGL